MHMGLVHHVVSLFTPQLLLLFTATTHGGMARLSYNTDMVYPIQVLTGPSVS